MKVLGVCPTTNKFIETHTGHQFVIYYLIEFERINKWLDRRIKNDSKYWSENSNRIGIRKLFSILRIRKSSRGIKKKKIKKNKGGMKISYFE